MTVLLSDSYFVQCPKCKLRMPGHDALEDINYVDGGEYEVSCDHCGVDFKVRVSVSVEFDSLSNGATAGS